jgi:hypothetical protein
MAESRKPFLSIAADVDDGALEAMARKKGVPAMTAASEHSTSPGAVPHGQGRGLDPGSAVAPRTSEVAPAPPRMSYVKACIPDYALSNLKARALNEDVTVNHLILKALTLMGVAIKPEHMVEDGRRLRGKNAIR